MSEDLKFAGGITFSHFKCSCGEEWAYNRSFDTTSKEGEELPKTLRLNGLKEPRSIHECENLTVYCHDKSIRRHYVKKT